MMMSYFKDTVNKKYRVTKSTVLKIIRLTCVGRQEIDRHTISFNDICFNDDKYIHGTYIFNFNSMYLLVIIGM